jgi:hypothetical protein
MDPGRLTSPETAVNFPFILLVCARGAISMAGIIALGTAGDSQGSRIVFARN